eukprot:241556-Amphidinium_carterae.1
MFQYVLGALRSFRMIIAIISVITQLIAKVLSQSAFIEPSNSQIMVAEHCHPVSCCWTSLPASPRRTQSLRHY